VSGTLRVSSLPSAPASPAAAAAPPSAAGLSAAPVPVAASASAAAGGVVPFTPGLLPLAAGPVLRLPMLQVAVWLAVDLSVYRRSCNALRGSRSNCLPTVHGSVCLAATSGAKREFFPFRRLFFFVRLRAKFKFVSPGNMTAPAAKIPNRFRSVEGLTDALHCLFDTLGLDKVEPRKAPNVTRFMDSRKCRERESDCCGTRLVLPLQQWWIFLSAWR
jgi:hypothetical protein